MDPVSLLIDGVAHLASGGKVTRREDDNYCIIYEMPFAKITWCGLPTDTAHIPRAADLLAGPLNICPDCRAMAAVVT